MERSGLTFVIKGVKLPRDLGLRVKKFIPKIAKQKTPFFQQVLFVSHFGDVFGKKQPILIM